MKKVLIILLVLLLRGPDGFKDIKDIIRKEKKPAETAIQDNVIIKYGTFLGNEKRSFYGKGPVPANLNVLWKVNLGSGETELDGKIQKWAGWGWTGQPILIEENKKDYLIAGSYSHKLRKIEADTGKIIWEYSFNDVIKATPAALKDRNGRVIILCGSRKGVHRALGDRDIYSFRAVSLEGKEIWRLCPEKTGSTSRDVDGTCIYDTGTERIYLGAENGIFYVLNPWKSKEKRGIKNPRLIARIPLYNEEDLRKHHGDIYIESSPSLSGDIIYISSGSGHIYGINRKTLKIVWDFYTGTDINGTVPISNDGCLFVALEKQYIRGKGGALKLNPAKRPEEAVEWFFPTGDRTYAKWSGGIIGSIAINDEYNTYPERSLAAFNAIDGYLYVVSRNKLEKNKYSELNRKRCSVPRLIFKKYIGGSISTPVFIDNYLITCGYDCRLHVFKISFGRAIKLKEVATFQAHGMIESTPLVWNNRIYISSRDGYLYCLGSKK